MTVWNIVIYVALIVFVIARRMIGRPVGPVKGQFMLPVVLVLIGGLAWTSPASPPG